MPSPEAELIDLLGPAARFRPPTTPALVVRRDVLEQNLKAMQGFCDAAGVALRAHGKMHKCPTLALRQVALGAVGVCCQTVHEAEAFAAAGVDDLLVTSPPAPWGAERLARLAGRGVRVAVTADSRGQIARLDAAAAAAGVRLGLIVDLDLGLHRTGARAENALALAAAAARAANLDYKGVQAYLGNLQHMADLGARRAGAERVQDELAALVGDLARAGLAPQVVTGGGTGTYAYDLAGGLFTEIQAGSYALMDVEYLDCGPPEGGDWPFRPALFVAATVISDVHKTHVVCDAGLKACSVDGPPARVAGGAPSGSRWRAMGDEHAGIFHPALAAAMKARFEAGDDPVAALDLDPATPRPADAPGEGDLVWLIPGHCDPTINLYDALWVVAEDGTAEAWPVTARRTSGLC